MNKHSESSTVAARRLREQRTISQMIALYCKGHHHNPQNETAYCSERVCHACKELDDYCLLRTQRCRRMDSKTSCKECENHCYAPDQQERIRKVMRYAGPRMLLHHPLAALRHLTKK